jgi:sarcosine oxidase
MDIRNTLRQWLPELADTPIDLAEVCLYNVAPEEQFQLASPAGRNDVVVANPCSGHGFKFSCLIGQVLADLITSGTTAVPTDAWKSVTS